MIEMHPDWLKKGWTEDDIEDAYHRMQNDMPMTTKHHEIAMALIRDGEEILSQEKIEKRRSKIRLIKSGTPSANASKGKPNLRVAQKKTEIGE